MPADVLAAVGLTPHQALAAGSWAARAYLGLGALTPPPPPTPSSTTPTPAPT